MDKFTELAIDAKRAAFEHRNPPATRHEWFEREAAAGGYRAIMWMRETLPEDCSSACYAEARFAAHFGNLALSDRA